MRRRPWITVPSHHASGQYHVLSLACPTVMACTDALRWADRGSLCRGPECCRHTDRVLGAAAQKMGCEASISGADLAAYAEMPNSWLLAQPLRRVCRKCLMRLTELQYGIQSSRAVRNAGQPAEGSRRRDIRLDKRRVVHRRPSLGTDRCTCDLIWMGSRAPSMAKRHFSAASRSCPKAPPTCTQEPTSV
jgi:hypothetical protein